jgi:hypothetical protein
MALILMKLNAFIFHSEVKPVQTNGQDIISDDNDNLLNSSMTYELLGINLDEHLNLNTHFSILCNKPSRALYILRQGLKLSTENSS